MVKKYLKRFNSKKRLVNFQKMSLTNEHLDTLVDNYIM